MSGYDPSVLNAEYQHTTFRVRKRGDVLGDLVPDLPPISRPFPVIFSLEKRLPLKVLPLVLQ